MNKKDLIEKIYITHSLKTKVLAENIVENVFISIKEAVRRGEEVRIGGFGVFWKKRMKSRIAQNPRTGASITVPEHDKVKFSLAKGFNDLVNKQSDDQIKI